MAKFTLEFLETKSPDWKIASLSGEGLDGIVTDVSINAKDKSGTPFPNFTTMMTGHTVEGDFWTSSTGKKYLFPPKPQPGVAQGRGGAGITGAKSGFGNNISRVMDKKAENIAVAQDNKEHGIKISSTMRDAVLIATTIVNNSQVEGSAGDMKDLIKSWRKWLWDNWDVEEPPF